MKTNLKFFLVSVFLGWSTVAFGGPKLSAICFDVNPEGAEYRVENPGDVCEYEFDGKRFYAAAYPGVKIIVSFWKTAYERQTVKLDVYEVFTIYDDVNLKPKSDEACAGNGGALWDFWCDLFLGDMIKPSDIRIV